MGNMLYYVNPPPRLPWTQLQYIDYFTSLDGYEKTVPAAPPNLFGDYIELVAESIGGTDLTLRKAVKHAFPDLDWTQKRTFKTKVKFKAETSDAGDFRIVTGSYEQSYCVGFRVEAGKLYAITWNGASGTETEIADWSGAAFDEAHLLVAIFYPLSRIEFYLDGTLAVSTTTNLPTGSSYAETLFEAYVSSTPTDERKTMELSMIMVTQED